MWTQLNLSEFKCFQKIDIPLRPLTLFCGINSSGKSSATHSLALLSQTVEDNEWNQEIQINGANVSLGAMEDIVNRTTGRKCFGIELETDSCTVGWIVDNGERQGDVVADITAVTVQIGSEKHFWSAKEVSVSSHAIYKPLFRLLPGEWYSSIANFGPMGESLYRIKYLSAERLGPRETYPHFLKSRIETVGSKGEFTPHFLDKWGEESANEGLLLNGEGKTIRRTVVDWMKEIFPGFDFEIQKLQGTGLFTLRIQTADSNPMFRPQNVGFGLTQVLPIVTLCVGAKKGDTLVIENPETHLHPAGQSAIGLFLGLTAASGVQIVVETHSDHVLNGIRKAVSRKILPSRHVVFDFFHSETLKDGSAVRKVTPLTCDDTGRISDWPAMFFDQMQNDLLELA